MVFLLKRRNGGRVSCFSVQLQNSLAIKHFSSALSFPSLFSQDPSHFAQFLQAFTRHHQCRLPIGLSKVFLHCPPARELIWFIYLGFSNAQDMVLLAPLCSPHVAQPAWVSFKQVQALPGWRWSQDSFVGLSRGLLSDGQDTFFVVVV